MLSQSICCGRTVMIAILISVMGMPNHLAQPGESKLSDVSPVGNSDNRTASVLFSDDFNDGNADGWTTSGDGTWFVEHHQYVVDMGDGFNRRGISVAGDTGWSDYVYEVDLQAVAGVDKVVLLRYQDDNNFYMMNIVGVYNFANLVRVENGVATTLVTVDYPHNNAEWHHVETIAHGNHVVAYVDGDLVINYIDSGSALTHGRVGLQGWTGEQGLDVVQFDNVVVRQLCLVYLPLVVR